MSAVVWHRRNAGHYEVVVDGRRLEVIGAAARGGWRSWVVFVDNQNEGSWPTFEQAKQRAVDIAKSKVVSP